MMLECSVCSHHGRCSRFVVHRREACWGARVLGVGLGVRFRSLGILPQYVTIYDDSIRWIQNSDPPLSGATK